MNESQTGDSRQVPLAEALQIAIDAHRQGELEKAEYIYTKIIELDPYNAAAIQFLGMVRHTQGRDAEGIALLERARGLAPKEPGILMNLGNVLLEAGHAEGALEAYKSLLELAPGLAGGWSNMGVLLRAMGRPEESEEALRKAIEINPRDAGAWHNLGNLLITTGRVEEATECGLRAVTLLPNNSASRKLLGIAYAYLGEKEKAREVFRAWLEEEPGEPTAEHHLAAIEGRTPDRASDAYVEHVFDAFAISFDQRLEMLEYRGPELVCRDLRAALDEGARVSVLDIGCGTGLVGPLVRPFARRLVGIDLSAKMLEKAEQRGVYDVLEKAEFIAFLAGAGERFDAILAADSLCYVGRMDVLAENAFAALAPGGRFVATFEAEPNGTDVVLNHSGRYAHGEDYLARTFAAAGFAQIGIAPEVLRMESGRPVHGFLLTAVRPA